MLFLRAFVCSKPCARKVTPTFIIPYLLTFFKAHVVLGAPAWGSRYPSLGHLSGQCPGSEGSSALPLGEVESPGNNSQGRTHTLPPLGLPFPLPFTSLCSHLCCTLGIISDFAVSRSEKHSTNM